MQVRLGLPIPGGALASTAARLRAPVLLSANAFSRRWPQAHRHSMRWPGFRRPGDRLQGLDAALDSAGFVAMATYRGFPWTVAEYVALAGSFPWTWWAQMDCCCEPEIAADRDTVLLRIAATARLLAECRTAARHAGVEPPMPVLQGWRPEDYLLSAELAPLTQWPDLVGIGSVCRRPIHGPDGLLEIVDRLDRAMPRHVRFHLFGVKGAGISALRGHDRIASVDSQAWDMAARRAVPVGRTMSHRIAAMVRWYGAQTSAADVPRRPAPRSLGLDEAQTVDGLDPEWIDLIAAGEIDLASVSPQRIFEALHDRD